MRLRSILLLGLFPISALSSQTVLSQPSTSSTTLVDILSADTDYRLLLQLLQRSKLIPTLNRLNESTLFAPTNDAIKKHASTHPGWQKLLDSEEELVPDNIQEELRQQLFYHLLHESIPGLPNEGQIQVLHTLLYPEKPLNPPTKEPPPWLPVPGGTLGGSPQRLRFTTLKDAGSHVGVDAFGKLGTKVVKDLQRADNGVLIGIGDMLEPPPGLASVIAQHTSTSYFNKVITPLIAERLNSTPQLTVFIPVDEAWKALHPVERLYLESEYATDDLTKILDLHAVVGDHVVWSESFQNQPNLTTVGDSTLDIRTTAEGIKVRNAKLVQPDIYASNGVLHLVDSLLLPPGSLRLTPEKYLLALNCSKFVSLLHSVDLTPLINDTEARYTILAPSDEVFSLYGDNSDLPERGSEELKKLLQYHFIQEKWTPGKLKNGTLLETALEESGLSGGHQVMRIEVHSEKKGDKDGKSVRFGGMGVIGDPVEVGNTLIYFISHPLVPPPDPLQAALPSLHLSSFLAAIFSTTKAEYLRSTPSTTFLLPHNDAFKSLGLLVSAHLLAPSSKDDLENVIYHHAIDTVQYARAIVNGSQHSFSTLESTDINVDRLKNGTVLVSSSGGWADLAAELIPRDLLTQTGVIHELSDILIPRSVTLSVGKLVKAAKANTMATLLTKAGFEWVLNGTAPPEDSPWFDLANGVPGWTLLCPPDDAFKKVNLTQLYADTERVKSIVTQHLIPMPDTKPAFAGGDGIRQWYNNLPLGLDDATYSTIRSAGSAFGDLAFQKVKETGEYIVGIKGARGTDGRDDWARVTAWGRTTTGGGSGGVIQIDRLLEPYEPSLWRLLGPPLTVGFLGVLGIIGFFYGVRRLWLRDTTEATYEPVGGFGRDDDDEI